MISFDFSTEAFITVTYSNYDSLFSNNMTLNFFQLGVKIGCFVVYFANKTKKALYSDNFDMLHLYPLITEVIQVK